MANKGQILIVDDEPIVRRAMKRILAGLGYEVIDVSCGNDAIKLLSIDLKKRVPQIKLLCLDWLMPNGSGKDVLNWKKRARHTARTLIMTAYGSNQITEEIRSFPVEGIMTKPFDNVQAVQRKVASFL